jgi:hypothetical protein
MQSKQKLQNQEFFGSMPVLTSIGAAATPSKAQSAQMLADNSTKKSKMNRSNEDLHMHNEISVDVSKSPAVVNMLECLGNAIDKIDKEFENRRKNLNQPDTDALGQKLLALHELFEISTFAKLEKIDSTRKEKSWFKVWKTKMKFLFR